MAGGTTTHYVHGLGGLLSGEYDNAGVLIREYIWLNGEPLAQIDKSGGTETVTYLHTDHLATPRYGTNAAGSTVWTWDSGGFGKETPTGSATVNLRFPGQYFDAETTLHYNWNRYYNPATGRYISSDPIGLAGGLATYNYAMISPLVFFDPEGLEWIDINDHIGGLTEKKIFGTNQCGCILKTFIGLDDFVVLSAIWYGVDQTGGSQKKPRGGVAGGGRSKDATSKMSQRAYDEYQKLKAEGRATAADLQKEKAIRRSGRRIIRRWVPLLGLVQLTYNVIEYEDCAKTCSPPSEGGPMCVK